MKVLMTADAVGGVWQYSLELAGALAQHDVRVSLATMGAPLTSSQRLEASRVPSLQLFESAYKLEWMEDPWQDVERAGEWLLYLERETEPDVVHLNGYVHAALCWRAPVLVVGHSCVLSWWEAVRGEPAPAAWSRYRRSVARGLRSASMVVAPTAAMLNALERHYGPLPRSRVIYNGRDGALFSPGQKEPFVLTVGRLWDEAKNVAAIQRVAPRLPWPVHVAGETCHPDGGQARLDGIRSLGCLSTDELARYMGAASIYALPARYEPFGLSALEAGLAGCALVLGDIPSLREVWGDAAMFVPPDDTDALQSALVRLIEDAELRESMSDRARHRAQQFSPRRMAESYLDVYTSLADSRFVQAQTAGMYMDMPQS